MSKNYQTFILNLDTVSVSISHSGMSLDPETGLSRVTGLKNSALSMAAGYCTFLRLTDIAGDLKTAGADDDLVNDILAGENLNQWVATSFQESTLKGGQTSGFFQIDNAPSDIATNAPSAQADYFAFLNKLKGGAVLPTAPINQDTAQGFVWQAVEKGYYEAISYLRNKVDFTGDLKDFSFARWAVEYARNQRPTHAPLNMDEHKDTDISPAYGFEQAMSYMYNRGQFPFARLDIPPGMYLIPLFSSGGAINEKLPYDGDDWGLKYVWQLPWLCTLLNSGTKIYDETISKDDVTGFLEILKGFFNGGDTSKDEAVDAGMAQAGELSWDKPFNGPETFGNMDKVVGAMMEAASGR